MSKQIYRHFLIFKSAAIQFLVLAFACLAAKGDDGRSVAYTMPDGADTLIGHVGNHATMSAGSGTIVHFSAMGYPDFISALSKADEKKVEGLYGINEKGLPENSGRLVFKANPGQAMPYTVFNGTNGTLVYHLTYLAITTAGNDTNGYSAYATRAIAFDNKVETISQTNVGFKMPEGGQLVIDRGRIKIGDNYINPNFDLSGKVK
jgi:hypothetical protein